MASSSGMESFSKMQRLILGVSMLVFVNVLSVLSTILDRRFFGEENRGPGPDTGRPFFTTFLKAAVCSVYLSGFLFLRGWRDQCRGDGGLASAFLLDDEAGPPYQNQKPSPAFRLSEPRYVPIKFDGDVYFGPGGTPPGLREEKIMVEEIVGSDGWPEVSDPPLHPPPPIPAHILANIAPEYSQKSSLRSPVAEKPSPSNSSSISTPSSSPSPTLVSKLKKKGQQLRRHLSSSSSERSVRFQRWTEVRVLNETYAEAAALARMSYQASLRMQALFKRAASRLTLGQVLKVSFIFSFLWFMAHLASAEALADTELALVQVMFSSSGLFTLVLAAVFPSSNHDKFTLSKLVAVLLSIGGSVLVCLPVLQSMPSPFPLRSLWALAAAFLFSTYVVYFQRQAENEDRLNVPLFLGFVGLFSMLLMWPGFFIARELNAEALVWPTRREWLHLTVNIMVCTFVSELLWLWGCLLTSSLVATSALSLKVPLNVMANMKLNQIPYTWFIYVGSLPISLGFLSIAAFSYYDSWDPVFVALKKLLHCLLRLRCLFCCCCCGGGPRGKTHARGGGAHAHHHDLLKEQKESLLQKENKCANS